MPDSAMNNIDAGQWRGLLAGERRVTSRLGRGRGRGDEKEGEGREEGGRRGRGGRRAEGALGGRG